jgi:hypothetical protein
MSLAGEGMKIGKLKNQVVLFSLAFLFALLFRLLLLGKTMLSDGESLLALQAMNNVAFPVNAAISNPAYITLTRFLFFVFSPSNFSARLISALFGSLLVLTPIFYRKWLGEKTAVLLAFLLALEPALFALSRQADSTTLAITATLIAMGTFLNGQFVLSGISLAFAILGGPVFWPFALSVFLAALWSGVFSKKNSFSIFPELSRSSLISFLIGFVPALILVGTSWFLDPQLLSGIPASLTAFFAPPALPENPLITFILMLGAGIIYLPVYWIVGIIGIIRAIRSKDALDMFLSRWLLIGFVIALLNPGRKLTDLAWVIIPLIVLVSRNLISLLELPEDNRIVFFAKAGFDLIILSFVWLNLLWIIRNSSLGIGELSLRLLAVAGAVLMIVLVTLLIGWGWSWRVTWKGLALSLMILLSINQLSSIRRAGGLAVNPANEFFSNSPEVTDNGTLNQILFQFSQNLKGEQPMKDVVVLSPYFPSLEWSLRDLPKVEFQDALDPNSSPDFVISSTDVKLASRGDYRGESLVWQQTTIWENLQWYDWANWLAFRNAPTVRETLLLWINTDLFPPN